MRKIFFAYPAVLLLVAVVLFGCSTAETASEAPAQASPAVQSASSGTCTDRIQNQDETGVDCGGVCPPCETAPVQQQASAVQPPPEPAQSPAEVEYEIAEEKLLELKSELTAGTKVLILSKFAAVSVGESYVFPYGMTNMVFDTCKFKYEIKFVSARDTTNSVIEGLDEETVLSWFSRNNFGEHTLGKYGQVFLPVGVTVGEEIGPGVKTVPGNYNFAIEASYLEKNWYNEYDSTEFTVRVK